MSTPITLLFPNRAADISERVALVRPFFPATLADVDRAIQFEAEGWCDRNGVPRGGQMPNFDYDDQLWHEIVWEACEHLGLEYDELFEVERFPVHDAPLKAAA